MMFFMKKNTAIWIVVGGMAGLIGCAELQPTVQDAADANASHSLSPAVNDEAYSAYREAHEHSPRIPKMIVALINSHLKKGEFLLAQFYCDEYLRDYPSGKERDEVDYLHLKILFYRYDREHDDRIAEQARTEAKHYLSTHGNFSPYRSRVEALLERLRQREKIRNEELAEFYKKRGKPKAEAIYREKAKQLESRK